MTVASRGRLPPPPHDPAAASGPLTGVLARPRWPQAALVTIAAAGAIHAALLAPRYHVGSFDDDANYVLAARAVAHGAGLTTKLPGVGAPLVGVYPPGFAAALAPVARFWPRSLVALRILPALCFAAIFPLAWRYLGRRGIPEQLRLAVLALLALNPVLATYATMVMPETAFVVVLLLLLLAVDRWRHETRTMTWAGLATVAGGGALIWLKEAGAGMVIGVVVWLLLRRLWRKALVAGAGTAVLLLPVLVARASAGVALIGSRYATDLGSSRGPAFGHLTHVAAHALGAYATDVVSRSVVGAVSGPPDILQWTAAPLTVIGAVAWSRRHLDVAVLAVGLYLAESLIYPFTNERRLVLVLPLVLAWYVLGVAALCRALARAPGRPGRAASVLALACMVLALVALLPQVPRDYLYALGQDSSAPGGSPYMAILLQLGRPADVVETDYLWTTALFSGHATANGAYRARCDPTAIRAAIERDRAGFLLSAALNRPDTLPSPCLLPIVAGQPSAVRLYRSGAPAGASVFELIGPGTGHPGLGDLTADVTPTSDGPLATVAESPQIAGDPAGSYLETDAVDGQATFTWSWATAEPVTQVSMGAASASEATASVTVEWKDESGQWRPAVAAPGPVGAQAPTRYLLASFPQPISATAIRVTVRGQGRAAVHDLHVL